MSNKILDQLVTEFITTKNVPVTPFNKEKSDFQKETIARYFSRFASTLSYEKIRSFANRKTLQDFSRILLEYCDDNRIFKIIRTVLYCISKTSGILSGEEKIQFYFSDLFYIDAGINGFAFEDETSPFVFKIQQNRNDEEFVHEAFVGMCLNSCRLNVPDGKRFPYGILNFSEVLNVFECSPPRINGKKIQGYCLNKSTNRTIIYEKIENLSSVARIVKGCSDKCFLQILLQILYALHFAQETLKFVHHDLHAKNCLIRELKEKEFFLPYTTEKGIEFMKCSFVVTIIDYGYCSVEYKGKSYGKRGLEHFGVQIENPHFFYDVFKFLMSSLSYRTKKQSLDFFQPVLNELFEGEVKFSDIFLKLREENENYFSLPYQTNLFKNWSCLRLAEFLRKQYADKIDFFYTKEQIPKNSTVYFVREKKVYNQIFTEIEIDNGDLFYEFISKLEDENLDVEIKREILKGIEFEKLLFTEETVYAHFLSNFASNSQKLSFEKPMRENVDLLIKIFEDAIKIRELEEILYKYKFLFYPSFPDAFLRWERRIEDMLRQIQNDQKFLKNNKDISKKTTLNVLNKNNWEKISKNRVLKKSPLVEQIALERKKEKE